MKILIVDDNESITRMMVQTLGLEGCYEVEVANNGFQAMDKILSFNPNLIILDLSMPGMSGQDTLIKIKEINPNRKVIIVTAHDDEKTKEFCLRHGALAYITKPFLPEFFTKTIKSVLSGIEYGPNEKIFLLTINKKLGRNFRRIFGENQDVEFQMIELKKYPSSQITSSEHSKIHTANFELPTVEIPSEQRGFTIEISGETKGSIITVVPDKFIEMIESFSGDAVGIKGLGDLKGFFNLFNSTVMSAVSDFLHVQLESKPVRPYDGQKDKMVKNTDLMEINYTFRLGDRSTWFTIYLWMNIFSSFEKKLKL